MADQDNYSDIQQEVPASADTEKDPDNVARGLKASIANPRVSDAAKENAREKLAQLGEPYDNTPSGGKTEKSSGKDNSKSSGDKDSGEKDPGNVARGLKAAISNEGVSEEAKERARERLEQM